MDKAERRSIKQKIQNREIDINNSQSFFSVLFRGFLADINKNLKIRGEFIPHIVVNTGDDTMYLNVKGYDHAKEPKEVTNEDYVYSMVPRATVQFNGINMQPDELTAPYSWGDLTVETPEGVFGAKAQFRRMPIKVAASVKYIFDDFSDLMECAQQVITNLAFLKDYTVTYMGQTINCTYKVPDAIDKEIQLEFDGVTTEAKTRTIELEYEIETNLPVYNEMTVTFNDEFVAYPIAVQSFGSIPERTKEETQKIIDETVGMRD